ncbi:hypothetical protein QWT69_07115 [Sporosarcina oncorhynchi]|uniref:Thioredoxin n=1 Tax=Sporosarcina oncorhynchi TaxID=3056444 RepID=A0ABZ0L8K4_9BACL|nr:hypothetical protein [Sporosarcina sp. T2O-4]WOV88866.1 hypothetical protein QWT69_07115 [Sporosarcina sp. T2O-4]
MEKKCKRFGLAALFLSLLLYACEGNPMSLDDWYSTDAEELSVYVYYDSFEQTEETAIHNKITEHLSPVLRGNVAITVQHDQTEEAIDMFKIVEFPTILVFDNERLLLQTTDFQQFEDFTKDYYSN